MLTTQYDKLARFYTPAWVGQILIDNVDIAMPRSILDLGCGEGALAAAARRRWREAKIITVDVDAQAGLSIKRVLSESPQLHRHVVADALDPRLGLNANLRVKSLDLAVCNPPFLRPRWRAGFNQILEAAGLSHVFGASTDVTSDLLFIAQNMRYLRPEGWMGLIVPDATITGEKMIGVRRALASQIERVIQLPRTAFKGTEAQTFILILGGRRDRSKIELREITKDGQYARPIAVTPDDYERLDYKFHLLRSRRGSPRRRSLADLGVRIVRGSLSSAETRIARFTTFHTTDFPTSSRLKLSDQTIRNPALVIAARGDILIARVDRRLSAKIAEVISGRAALSDCVYRIRCTPQLRKRVLAGLLSSNGQFQINALARGNGARHISIRSLLAIVV